MDRRILATYLALLTLTVSAAAHLLAEYPKPDTSYGSNGIAVLPTKLGPALVQPRSLLIDTLGRQLVAGEAVSGGRRLPVLARFTTNGSLDTTFGQAGRLTLQLRDEQTVSHVQALLKSDGSIEVLAQLNQASLLVVVLGANGQVLTRHEVSIPGITDLSLGKVIALPGGGYLLSTSYYDKLLQLNNRLIKLDATLALDTAFGSNGFRVSPYLMSDMLVDDGAIVLAYWQGLLEKIDSNGQPVSSFANSGVFQTSSPGFRFDALAKLSNGNIVVSGTNVDDDLNSTAALVLQISADGVLNTGFANAGVFLTPLDPDCPWDEQVNFEFSSVQATTNGGMLLARSCHRVLFDADIGEDIVKNSLVRLLANGSADTSLAGNGVLNLADPGAYLLVASTGEQIYLLDTPKPGDKDFSDIFDYVGLGLRVHDFNSVGTARDSYGDHSVSIAQFQESAYQHTEATLSLANGAFLTAARDDSIGMFLFRYTPAGLLDPVFGNSNGYLQLPPLPIDCAEPAVSCHLPALHATRLNQTLVIAETVKHGGPFVSDDVDIYALRVTAEGVVDFNYSADGWRKLVNIRGGTTNSGLTADDKLLLMAGDKLHRFDATGLADMNFGDSGVVKVGNRQDYYSEKMSRVLIDINNRLLVQLLNIDDTSAVITRLTADGKVDSSFGDKGNVQTPLPMQVDAESGVISIDHRGRLLMLTADGKVMRWLDSGSLDTQFANGGLLELSQPDGNALAVLADSSIVVGGPHWLRRFDMTGKEMPDFNYQSGDGSSLSFLAKSVLPGSSDLLIIDNCTHTGCIKAMDPGNVLAMATAPNSLDMGGVILNHSASRDFQLRNTGNRPLLLTLQSDHTDFAVSGCSAALSPNSTCTVTVKFTPMKTGKTTSTISINSTAAQQQVNVSGEGLKDNNSGGGSSGGSMSEFFVLISLLMALLRLRYRLMTEE